MRSDVGIGVVIVATDIETPEERLAAALQRRRRQGAIPWRPSCQLCPVSKAEILRQRGQG